MFHNILDHFRDANQNDLYSVIGQIEFFALIDSFHIVSL